MLMSESEAARYLNLSPRTLEKSRSTGLGPCYVKQGRRVSYRREDLDAWIAARVRTSTSDRSAA
jgi:excisionase family DNA binding protein